MTPMREGGGHYDAVCSMSVVIPQVSLQIEVPLPSAAWRPERGVRVSDQSGKRGGANQVGTREQGRYSAGIDAVTERSGVVV